MQPHKIIKLLAQTRNQLLLGIVLLFGSSAHAQFRQENTGALTAGATANYRFADLNELSISVTLLGAVQRPGRYEISRKIDLVNLLALAGGWQENADVSDVRISREIASDEAGGMTELRLDLENLTDLSPKVLQLKDGDCVYVAATTPVTLPLLLSVISSAATVAMAVAYFTVARQP